MKTEFTFLPQSEPLLTSTNLTSVFIDYESLFISHRTAFQTTPDLKALVEDFRSIGKIALIKVFGDFTKPELLLERNRVRTITNNIIDCGHESSFNKKDYTDFIMLDHIYQEAIQNAHIKQFVIVTGDGHFSSVATFLRMTMDRVVGVYSMTSSLSHQLRDCASWTRCITITDDEELIYMQRIASNLIRIEQEGKFATFNKTCEIVSTTHNLNYDSVRRVLGMMVNQNLVISEEVTSNGVTFRRIYPVEDIQERINRS